MSQVAVVEDSLEALATTVRQEHSLSMGAMRNVLFHAVRAGEALMEVKKRKAPHGEWEAWVVDECGVGVNTARTYVRLAIYKDIVLGLPDGTTVTSAIRDHLRGLPPADPVDGRGGQPYPDEVRDRARELREAGGSYRQISRALGVNRKTVQRWLDDTFSERGTSLARNRRRSRRAAEARDSETALRSAGGIAGEAYKLTGRIAAILEEAKGACASEEGREMLADALLKLEGIQDDIAGALDLERPTEQIGFRCEECGEPLSYAGVGRPKKFCVRCAG